MSGGFKCPRCGVNSDGVIDSRPNRYGIRRMRKCAAGHKFGTQEMLGDVKVLEKLLSERNVIDLRSLPDDEREAIKTLFFALTTPKEDER